MRKVKNKKAIQKLALRTMKSGRGRYLIAVCAIILTAVLFTSVFTVGGSLISKQQQGTMRQVGGSAQGGFKYLTREEYDIVKKDKKLKDISYRTLVGEAVNEELIKLRTEISYYEDLNAKLSFCYPEEGKMPRKEDELVTSDLVLEALGIPCEIGQQVPVKLDIGGRIVEKTFTLSGYFKGDIISMSQVMAVSKEFAEREAPTPVTSIQDHNIMADDYPGRIMADYNFYTSFNLEKQQKELVKRCGFSDAVPAGLNWAYMSAEVDMYSVSLVLVLLAIILVSGYLIIYNIFYINVYHDIRYYGLLKTIGTTEKQLRKIVRRQAYLLSLAGIPLGLLAGVLVGKVLLPVVMETLVFKEGTNSEVVLNGWIFAASALFTFLTVYISSVRPCRAASSVSPIEAVRYTEGQNLKKSSDRKKKTHKVSPARMAFTNMKRNKRKAVLVVLSITLGLVLLNSVYGLVTGFDMEKFVASSTVSDFSVQGTGLDNPASSEKILDGVTPEFLKEASGKTGITKKGNVYLKQNNLSMMTEAEFTRFEERIRNNPDLKAYFSRFDVGMEGYMEEMWENKRIDSKIYGISDMLLPKLELTAGKLDAEKFNSGNYIIVNRIGSDEYGKMAEYCHVGEKVSLPGADGVRREYEVMAIAEMPYAACLQMYGVFDCTYILPEQEFLALEGPAWPMRTLINMEPESRKQMNEWLESYCTKINPDLDYSSRDTIAAEFTTMKNMYSMVGGLLALILALIGILNFVNTMVTSVYSRKKEFAMMEAVGMTEKQLRQMLCFEGCFYAVFTLILALSLGGILSATVIKDIGNSFFFFTWHFSVTPILLCIPVLFIFVLLVPFISCRRMQMQSVVLRMRAAD